MGRRPGQKGLLPGVPLYIVTIIVLAAALVFSLLAAVTFGTMDLPLSDVYTVLLYRLRHALLGTPFPEAWAPGTAMHDVVWLIRLPRLVLAAAVGMALSVSGVVMQAIVKNPLADPYILGISSGASLAPRWQCCWVWGQPLAATMSV